MSPAINTKQIKQDVEDVWKMKEGEIYRHLGLAYMGTTNVVAARMSMKRVMSAAASTDAETAVDLLSKTLEKDGKKHFNATWKKIKKIACQLYSSKPKLGGKDLVEYLVTAVAALVSITSAVAILVITLAVKYGLDKLCSV